MQKDFFGILALIVVIKRHQQREKEIGGVEGSTNQCTITFAHYNSEFSVCSLRVHSKWFMVAKCDYCLVCDWPSCLDAIIVYSPAP